MACAGFVMSLATLALYGRGLELLGAKLTLTLSAAGCSVLFFSLAAGLSAYESGAVSWTLVGALFVFRETYVTLIGTQVWALLSAELKQRGPETSRIWFCLIQVLYNSVVHQGLIGIRKSPVLFYEKRSTNSLTL